VKTRSEKGTEAAGKRDAGKGGGAAQPANGAAREGHGNAERPPESAPPGEVDIFLSCLFFFWLNVIVGGGV